MTIQSDQFAGAPSFIPPGTLAVPPVAPVYVDGIPLATALSAPVVPSPGNATPAQKFWSSVPRPAGDPNEDNLVISLGKADYINYIHLELAHFPHQVQVFWLGADNAWQPVLLPSGAPLTYVVSGSVPAVVNNASALSQGLNPYHYGAGHWLPHDDMIIPVTASQLLFCLTREFSPPGSGQLPVDPGGHPSPYPLGIRNLDFGFRARSKADIPWTPRSPVTRTERLPFGASSDLRGNPVTLAVRENRAADLLAGTNGDVQVTRSPFIWKSAPQPRSDSVVSLYADCRDAQGNPQVIDRFYIVPVTSGVSLNLYHAASPPPVASFQASDVPLAPPFVTVNGASLPAADGEGLLFASVPGWLTLSGQATELISSSPWWEGLAVMPQFAASDPGTWVILDDGTFRIWFQAGTWYVATGDGILAAWSVPFSLNDSLAFVVGFDGSQLFAWNPLAGFAFAPAPPPSAGSGVIQLGAFTDTSGQAGNYRLSSYILKQEAQDLTQLPAPPDFLSFAVSPDSFVAPAAGPGPTTMNALARFSPSFILGPPGGISPLGFAGGPGALLENCRWIPVARDYKLYQGFLEFDPVLACAFKFEFTSLRPLPHEFLEPVPLPAKSFPSGGLVSAPLNIASPSPSSSPAQAPGPSATVDTGMIVNQAVAPLVAFADRPAPTTTPPQGAALPTEAAYATDPAAATALAERGGSLYNFQQWLPQPSVPRFQLAGVPHSYQSTDIQHNSRVAYFVAISRLQAFRTSYAAQDDAEMYAETFADTANISAAALENLGSVPSPWNWQPGSLSTGPHLTGGSQGFSQAYSDVLSSQHQVRGIQFAASQSDPVQLLPDPDFTDPELPGWSAAGDAAPLEVSPSIIPQLGNLVMVTRIPSAYTWEGMSIAYPTWSAFPAGITWGDLQGGSDYSTYGGMSYTGAPLVTTGGGRVYAAARVYSPVPLSAPLALQVLDGASGQVLAEADSPVGGGAVTEWYAGYTIGAPQSPSSSTWAQVQANYPTWDSTAGLTWGEIDTFVPPLGSTVSVQLIQKQVTEDTWGVDNISIFDDAITWEFSNDGGVSWHFAYDIRNNPRGVMLFPPPAQGTGDQLMWRLSGYRAGLYVSGLAIRPWYGVHPQGSPPRAGGAGHGPNMTPLDHYCRIEDDPRWKAWDLPVPLDWWFAYRQLLLASGAYAPALPASASSALVTLGNALIVS